MNRRTPRDSYIRGRWTTIECELTKTSRYLDQVVLAVEAVSSGTASGADVDERGNTFLGVSERTAAEGMESSASPLPIPAATLSRIRRSRIQ